MPRTVSRRRFLKSSSLAAAASLAAPVIAPAGVVAVGGKPGASDRVRIGFIGAGGRANLLMTQTPAPGHIVAICDVDKRRCEQTLARRKTSWRICQDYRRILDAKDIDAVVVPTHDHGRVLPCIHACQAGKDVYAEKPLSLTIAEGRALVKAVRKYKRVFQTGTQQRSMEMNRYACELVRTGGIGRVHLVLAVNYPGPVDIGPLEPEPCPKEVDWDAWCAQTPMRPYNSYLQRRWNAKRGYSGGQMTNWGAHGTDQIQWALGMDHSGPVEVWPETPGVNGEVSLRYASGVLVKFVLPYNGANQLNGGAVFIGEKGRVTIHRNRFFASPEELAVDPPEPQTAEIWEGPGWQAKYHIGEWFECIKTREKPVADIEIGHRSVVLCHLANLARDLGRKLTWDPEHEVFVNDHEANGYLDRPKRQGYEIPNPL